MALFELLAGKRIWDVLVSGRRVYARSGDVSYVVDPTSGRIRGRLRRHLDTIGFGPDQIEFLDAARTTR